MPPSIRTVSCVADPSSSTLSEPRRPAIVPLSTTVTFGLATGWPINPVKAEVFLRLKSASSPWPTASCSRTPGHPGPSTTCISPAGAGTAPNCRIAPRAASCARLSGLLECVNCSRPARPPPPAEPFVLTAPSFAMTNTFSRHSGWVSLANAPSDAAIRIRRSSSL